MIKLFEYREYKNTEDPVPFCWKVLATLFTASVFLAMAVVCNSCQSDEIDTEVVVEEGQPATIRLEVTGEEEMDVATRTVNESVISNLHVLVYNSKGELIGQKYQTGSPTVTVNTIVATGCTIYAIANTGNPNLFSGYAIHKETYLKEMARTVATWNAFTSGADLPMTGSAKNVSITASTSLSMTLTRMVAKVTLDIGIEPNSGITISSCSLCNLPKKSYYVHRPLSTEAKEDDTENAATVAGKDAASDIAKDYFADSKISVSSTAASATFYMFENRKGVNANITNQDEKGGDNAPANATYVKINGTLNATPVSWKVYLGANNTTNFNIKRNRLYTCKITLKATGVADSRITFEPTGIVNLSQEGNANCYLASANNHWYSFDATVRGNGETQDYANLQYGSIRPGISLFPSKIDGSTSAVKIPKAKVWDAVVVWETNKDVIDWVVWERNSGCVKFKTGPTLGNAVIAVRDKSKKILWSWHIWRTDGVNLSDLNASNSKHTMTITTNTNRQWYIDLMAKDNITNIGRVRTITMLRCNLGSKLNDECYYADPRGNVGSYGVQYQFGRKDPFMAEMSYANHDEKPIYGYGSSDTFNDAGFTVNDKKQSSNASLDAKATIDYTIAHPEVYIYSTNNNGGNNWIHDAGLNTDGWRISRCLWGDNNSATPWVNNGGLDPDPWGTPNEKGKKTIYDPCPAGWRVAPADSWTGLADNNASSWTAVENTIVKDAFDNGYVFYFGSKASGISTLCPAIGRRMYNTGSLADIATLGGLWWSSPSGTESMSGTYFYSVSSGTVHMASDHRPAMGYPIRCAKIEY